VFGGTAWSQIHVLVHEPYHDDLVAIISNCATSKYIEWSDLCFLPNDSLLVVASKLSAIIQWDVLSQSPSVLAKDFTKSFVRQPRVLASRDFIAHGMAWFRHI